MVAMRPDDRLAGAAELKLADLTEAGNARRRTMAVGSPGARAGLALTRRAVTAAMSSADASLTVEYHLRHVYQKLGIHSPDELAETLAAHRALVRQQVGGGSIPPGGAHVDWISR
jgi:hypothetical protein